MSVAPRQLLSLIPCQLLRLIGETDAANQLFPQRGLRWVHDLSAVLDAQASLPLSNL
jgi:hypothetical protein